MHITKKEKITGNFDLFSDYSIKINTLDLASLDALHEKIFPKHIDSDLANHIPSIVTESTYQCQADSTLLANHIPSIVETGPDCEVQKYSFQNIQKAKELYQILRQLK